MAMQEVEYEFPDPEKKEKGSIEVDIEASEDESTDIEVEGAVGRETIGKPKKKEEPEEESTIQAGDVEIEVEDDTPKADRNRKKSDPPEEVTDEELENYSEKVKKRIQHFSKGYHDERRAKEQALREREALEQYTKTLVDENKKLRGEGDKSYNTLIEQAKRQAQAELELAKRQYKEAYEAGDTDKVVEAQEALTSARIRVDRAANLRPKQAAPLQETEIPVNNEVNTPQQAAPQRDERAESWRDENSWFGSDREMTAFALGLHAKLTEEEGISPTSDTYYKRIDARMRQVFPDQFDDGIDDEPEEKPKAKTRSNVVAPATRSTSPNKVRLSQSQIAIAKRLGVPLDTYAKQVAELARKQNG
jgi:hypothetical protein